MDEFFKQKIIYPNMTKYLPFFLDQDNFFTNQKCFIITGEHLGFLVAFFNSNIFKFCFRDSFPTLQGGTRELSKVFFEKIPVIKVDDRINKLFETKIIYIQTLTQQGRRNIELENGLDNMLFDLYGLTKEEKDLIKSFSI